MRKKMFPLIMTMSVLYILSVFFALPALSDLKEKNETKGSPLKLKIYCAGPLFNAKEREEMKEIVSALEQAGFSAFLPQRDGLLFSELSKELKNRGLDKEKADKLLLKAIFVLDAYQVLNCQGLVLNMNGRVPDEGSLVEEGIAWCAGKAVAIYKTDERTLINGKDNPMIVGPGDFETAGSYDELVKMLVQKMRNIDTKKTKEHLTANADLQAIYVQGEKIADLLKKKRDQGDVATRLLDIMAAPAAPVKGVQK